MTFSDLTIGLNLNIAKFTNAMNRARQQTQRFSSHIASLSTDGSADKLIEGYTTLNERLHRVGLGARDVARIVAGMTISQTFYGITRSIREATDALWEFNKGLDYAQVTYGALFGSSDLASDFIDTLKQFSIDTIFEYSDIEGMARKLSAYGIEYKNLMYIIEGLTNIGTISGDTAALERLAVAIGQINAKGTLKAEEMRQLANAYTPIYDILREKLGLSEDELGMVGDLGISSADAINAIIEYANETFGATADAAVKTITGLNNRIVDSLKVMGADIMSPLTTFYKSLANFIAGQLESIYDIYKTSGLGGVFEYLVPSEEWQQRIRSLVATLKNSISTIAALVATLWPYIEQFFGGMIEALTLFLGILNVALGSLVGFLQATAENTQALHWLTSALVAAAGGWLLFKVHAMGAAVISVLKVIIVDVAKAVVFLTAVLTKNPIIGGLLLLGAVLLGVATNANNTNSAISNLINTLNSYSLGGNIGDDMMQIDKEMANGAPNAEDFWNKMEEGADGAGDSIDGAGDKAKKAAKSLLSFDEVFRLNENESSNSNAPTTDLSGIMDLAGVLGGLGEALIPEIPDLSSFTDDFVNSLYNSMWNSIKTIASGGATGAIIGGLVGFTIGGFVTKTMKGALTGAKWGAAIGSIAGAGFAGFWTDSYNEFEKSLSKIATGGASGALIGGLIGMVVGAFATKTVDGALAGAQNGARLGGMIGLGLGTFWASATEEMDNAIEGLLVGAGSGSFMGSLAGLIIGAFCTKTLKGALEGAKYGAALGGMLGGIFGGFFGAAEGELQNQIGRIAIAGGEGVLLGAVAGMLIGAFATKTLQGAMAGAKYGSAIGAAIGTTVGAVFDDAESTLTTRLEGMFSTISAAGVGSLIGGLAGMIIGAVVGAFAGGIGAIPGAKAGAALGSTLGALGGMLVGYLDSSGITEALGSWFDSLWTDVTDWFSGLGESLSTWFSDLGDSISTWFSDAGESISTWFSDLYNSISTWCTNTIESISNWVQETANKISTWYQDTKDKIDTWARETGQKIKTWCANAIENVSTWYRNTMDKISNWALETDQKIKAWCANAGENIANWYNDTMDKISDWANKTDQKIETWCANAKSNISSWASETKSKLLTWYEDTSKGMSDWVEDTKKNLKQWWTNLWDPSTWPAGWERVKSWFNNLWSSISSWFSRLRDAVSSWWDSIWNGKAASITIDSSGTGGKAGLIGHAKGGIFNREHIARFAEGNKAEAIIPLEDNAAMQPFVNAISDGILQGLLPAMSNNNGSSNNLPPMYVGTLIADERGLQQLFKKFELYEAKELARKGMA